MSLTFPSGHSGFQRSSTNENWIFCLGYDDSFDMVGTENQLNEDLNTTETDINVKDGTLFTIGNYYRMNTIGTQVFTTGELIKGKLMKMILGIVLLKIMRMKIGYGMR